MIENLHKYLARLDLSMRETRSLICVGLDPVISKMPITDITKFNCEIVNSTADHVCAYKPNLGFYEAMGLEGLKHLEATIEHIRNRAPHAIIIGDGKRGDIASTSEAYSDAMFNRWDFDATTVNPYGGLESLEPFFEYEEKCVYIWCRSSNPGAMEFQDLLIQNDNNKPIKLYEQIALSATRWKSEAVIGLVSGASYANELENLRNMAPNTQILAPGIGEQGGDLKSVIEHGVDKSGRGLMINSSRSILYASKSSTDFGNAANMAVIRLKDDINKLLCENGFDW